MKKLFLSLIFVSAVFLGVLVIAQTITGSFLVNANSCFESDGGLNYGTYGTVNGSFWWPAGNGTNGTFVGVFTDTCVNSRLLLEGVCGASISPNYSSIAGGVYVDCSRPNSAFGCVNGACVFVGNNNTNSTNSTLGTDLIISNLTYTYTVNGTTNSTNSTQTRYNVVIVAAVKNIGNAAAGASMTRIGLNVNSLPFASYSSNVATPALSPGQSTLVYGYYPAHSGQILLNATADSTNLIAESNENNNFMSIANYLP